MQSSTRCLDPSTEQLQTVLDIASATGAQCRRLHAAGLIATGLDLSEAMIRLARRRGPKAITYVLGSAFDLPFEDNRFDAALLVLALHEHTERHRQAMLREAQRVTQPGGQLIVIDYMRPPNPRANPLWWAILGIEKLAGATHHTGFAHFMGDGGLTGLIERFGPHQGVLSLAYCGTVGIVRITLHR